MKTTPGVFIVESLKFSDEDCDRREGLILSDILRLARTPADYRYIRTTKELKAILEQFERSGMRYLHLSCHGNRDCIALTLDTLSFEEFGGMVRPYLRGRRLFVSACSTVNKALALSIMPQSDCWSVIGPRGDIAFDDAVLMWASFSIWHLRKIRRQ